MRSRIPLVQKGFRYYGVYWVWTAIAIYTVVFFILQCRLYSGLHMGIWDIGIFNQALYGSFQGRFLSTSYTGPSAPIFTEHLYLIIAPLLPLYGVFRTVHLLFLAQAFVVALGAIAIFLIGREVTEDEILATILATAYLLYPSIQGMTLNMFIYGFHPDNFFPTFLLFAFYFFLKQRVRSGYVFVGLALSCGEHLAPTVAVLGIYLAVKYRHHRTAGAALIGVSVVWMLLATLFVIPTFRGDLPWYLDRTISAVGEPGRMIPRVTSWNRLSFLALQYVEHLLVPVLLTPLFDISSLLIAVPGLVMNSMAYLVRYRTGYSTFSWHMAKIAPFIFLSAVLGVGRLVGPRGIKATPNRLKYCLAGLILLASVVTSFWLSPMPWSRAVEAGQYADLSPERKKILQELSVLIDPEDSLSADMFWGSHFTSRETIHLFPYGGWRDHDWVLIDTKSKFMELWIEEQIEFVRASPDYQLVVKDDGVELYRYRPREVPQIQVKKSVVFSNRVRLHGYNLNQMQFKPGDELTLGLFWAADEPVDKSYTIFVHVVTPDGRIVAQSDSIPVNGSYPTNAWPVAHTIWDEHRLRLGAELLPGSYEIKVGLYYWEDGKRADVLDENGSPVETTVSLGSISVGR